MEVLPGTRGRGIGANILALRNKQWNPDSKRHSNSRPPHPAPDSSGKWERGGNRGGRRARGTYRGISKRFNNTPNGTPSTFPIANGVHEDKEPSVAEQEEDEMARYVMPEEPVLETADEREKFYQEVRFYPDCMRADLCRFLAE